MYLFTHKQKNTGRIQIILTHFDEVDMVVNNGVPWISINDIFNDFNTDPNITNVQIAATYTNSTDVDEIKDFIKENGIRSCNTLEALKVDNNGKVVKNKNKDEDNEEDDEEETGYTCRECGDEGKALIDKDGNTYPCKSCIEIDAYIKGRNDGVIKSVNILQKYASQIDKDVFNKIIDEINSSGTVQKKV